MEQLALASFACNGHQVHLYVYGHVDGVPAEVTIRDARSVLPEDAIFAYGPEAGQGAGRIAAFANVFRYKLLLDRGGWWFDTDMVCLRPLDISSSYAFGLQDESTVNNAIMLAPQGSALMKDLYERAAQMGQAVRWGEAGPQLLTRAISEHGLDESVLPRSAFYPVHFDAVLDLFEADGDESRARLPAGSYTVHFWNEMLTRRGIDKSGQYPESSMFERLKRRYSIVSMSAADAGRHRDVNATRGAVATHHALGGGINALADALARAERARHDSDQALGRAQAKITQLEADLDETARELDALAWTNTDLQRRLTEALAESLRLRARASREFIRPPAWLSGGLRGLGRGVARAVPAPLRRGGGAAALEALSTSAAPLVAAGGKAFAGARHSARQALRRGAQYRRHYGTLPFVLRLAQPWTWTPKVLSPPGVPASLLDLPQTSDKLRLLMFDRRVPAYDRASGYLRVLNLLKLFLKLDFDIYFLPQDLAATQPYTRVLGDMGVHVLHGAIDDTAFLRQNAWKFDCFLVEEPDVAEQYAPLLKLYAPSVPLVYDSNDLHYLRERRRAEVTGSRAARRSSERYREVELRLFEMCDATIAITEHERQQILADVPGARVYVVSNLHEPVGPGKPFAEREGLLFTGNFLHAPNGDAAAYLVSSVLPLIRGELGDVPLYIVGSEPDAAVRGLAGPGVSVTGWVPDLAPYLEGCRVFVAPLRFGAGVKGKITESMAWGLPVVTTPTGAEGFEGRDGEEFLVARDEREFAAKVAQLYRDAALWERIAANSRRFVAERFSPEAAERTITRLLADFSIAPAEEPVSMPGAGGP